MPNYPPMEFRDPATNTLTGFDVDLGEAIGRKLGIKIEWQETSFDQFMPRSRRAGWMRSCPA